MTTFNLGKFGDGNKYTVFSHDLKSQITAVPNSAWSTLIMVGTGNPVTTDSELGTKFIDANGNETGYRFQTMSSSIAKIDKEGHIKFKIESKWVCPPELNANGNSGDILNTLESVVSAIASTSPSGTLTSIFTNGSNKSATSFVNSNSGSVRIDRSYNNQKLGIIALPVFHMAGKSRFIDVDIFWKGKYAFLAIDSVVCTAIDTRNANGWTNIWNNFYIGNHIGSADKFVSKHWTKDFEIRTKCPEFSLNYSNHSIGVLSDSLFDSLPMSSVLSGDVSAQYRIQRKFNTLGQYININISENAGYRVYNTGSDWLGSDSIINSVLSSNPSKVLVSGGTNDNSILGLTENDFKLATIDILEKLLGENGNTATNVREVLWLIPIPLYGTRLEAAYTARVAASIPIRSFLLSIAETWDLAYPLRKGAVKSLDMFKALGGESELIGNDLYIGQNNGTLLNLHLGAHGMQIWGDAIASSI